MRTGASLEFWASQVIANYGHSWCCSSTADSNYNYIIIIFQHILNKYEKHPNNKLKLLIIRPNKLQLLNKITKYSKKYIASHVDILRGSSRIPAPLMSLVECVRNLKEHLHERLKNIWTWIAWSSLNLYFPTKNMAHFTKLMPLVLASLAPC